MRPYVVAGLAGVGLLGAWALSARAADAAPASALPPVGPAPLAPLATTPTPGAAAPVGDATQTRPFPDIALMRAGQRRDVLAVAQRQLNALGYGPVAVDGVEGTHTDAAAVAFAGDYAGAVDAYRRHGFTVAEAVLSVLDDVTRGQRGDTMASDYVAPSGALRASGCGFLARHR